MKGLLLKDFYMLFCYCRLFLLVIAVFLAAGMLTETDMTFLFIPCMFAGLLPVTLQAYDERSGWCRYSGVLPYTRAQLVSVKYLLSLLLGCAVVLLAGVAYLLPAGAAEPSGLASLLAVAASLTLIFPALLMPFVFRFGSEKGRIAYLILVGGLCAGGLLLFNGEHELPQLENGWQWLLIGAAALLYTGSWLLSVAIYQARESV